MSSSLVDPALGHLLDRPIWSALSTRHRQFALGDGAARCFKSDIAPFAASRDDSRPSLEDLGRLVLGSTTDMILLQFGEIVIPNTVRLGGTAEGVQMLAERPIVVPEPGDIVRLTADDVPEMLALAKLTRPGPFEVRTHLLGSFFGIRHEGRLVAMAGERLKQPGFTEASAVCVHPDHRGRGHASRLSATVAGRIQARGETAYLHTFADNTAAIRLYERQGFLIRGRVNVALLQHAGARDGQPEATM